MFLKLFEILSSKKGAPYSFILFNCFIEKLDFPNSTNISETRTL